MKIIAGSIDRSFAQMLVLVGQLSWLALSPAHGVELATDPTLNLTLARSGQNVVLNWLGANAVPYQLEASSNLTTWVNLGASRTGTGAMISVTNPVAGLARSFYRVSRLFPAAQGSAVFNPATGLLTIVGTPAADTLTVSLSGTTILVNGGAIPVTGGVATVTNTALIQVLALAGNDQVTLSGLLPPTHVFGDTGNDTLIGGAGAEMLVGGPGNDLVDGNQGNDRIFLGEGDDVFQWDPGDGLDTVEGQAGSDTVRFNGANIAEIFDLAANGSRVRFTRNVANIVLDLNGIENFALSALGGADTLTVNDLSGTDLSSVSVDLASTLGGNTGDAAADTIIVNGTNGGDTVNVVGTGTSASVIGLPAQVSIANAEGANDALVINALGGADSLTATTLPAGVLKLTLDGGTGNDSLFGSQGDDILIGGDGDDFILGDNGNDVALMGANNDVFQWDPGDGNDTIEGQGGLDRLIFSGANVAENIDIAANGGRVRFFRDVASVTMDLDDVESIDFRALGGADNVVVGDLSGTDVAEIALDLRGPNGGGDGAADTITVNATQADDVFGASGDTGGITVFGLHTVINILFQEQANDRLTLNAQGGNDVVDASLLKADGIQLTMNGGLGADVFFGSEGDDLIIGGDGNDTALMGAGNDTFVWNPGDDNDIVEGQAGSDKLQFNGANIAERINLSANGGRLLFTRDVASVIMDLNDVENIEFIARGGADTITISDLSNTDVTGINLNLESTPGSGVGDGAADTVIVTGTSGDDVALVDGDASGTSVRGLAAAVNITGAEAANDRLTINSLAGNDVVEASGLLTGAIQLTADGGSGDDILIGGAGNDTFAGGDDNDVLLGGPGVDVLDGGLGENIVIQDGTGSATGIVSVFGTAAANTITISRDASGNILTNGVPVAGATVANTALIRVFGLGGDDVITFNEANGALPAARIFGGTGNDTLTGGSGADLLFGGSHNDTLLGLGGSDLLFGGADNDTLTGGDADDQAFGEAGNDRFFWNPDDDTDLNEGGSGTDTVEVNGGNGAEDFTVTANGTRVRFDRVNPAPFSLDIGTCESLVANCNGGDDSFSATGNLAALIQLTVDGGAGNDTLLGGNGNDVLLGGDGNDFIDGNQGNDTALLGSGDDVFQWDPGDGLDTVEGQTDNDTLRFNGSNIAEIFDLSANGSRVRLTRNIGSVVLDLNGIENLSLNALGGADSLTVNDLAGTSLTAINADLAGTLGGTIGDAAADTITVNGTASADAIFLTANAGAVEVSGLAALVRITHSEAANDRLIVNGLGGVDTFTVGPGVTVLIGVTVNQ